MKCARKRLCKPMVVLGHHFPLLESFDSCCFSSSWTLLLPFTYAAFTLQLCCGGRSCKGRRLNRETCDFHTHNPHILIFEKFFLRLCQRLYKIDSSNGWVRILIYSCIFLLALSMIDTLHYFGLHYSVNNIFITALLYIISHPCQLSKSIINFSPSTRSKKWDEIRYGSW